MKSATRFLLALALLFAGSLPAGAQTVVTAPEAPFERGVYRPSSTDMGDVSMIMPALHGYFRGFSGTAHTDDFLAADLAQAYVEPAKMLALNVIDLLYGDGSCAAKVAAIKPPMTRAEYLNQMDGFSSRRLFDGK